MTVGSDSEYASRLYAERLRVSYGGGLDVLHDVSLSVPDGGFTVIIGPNACGKSTLLKCFARMLPLKEGRIVLDGKDVRSFRPKEVARLIGLLPQNPHAPDGITAFDLVARGRYPHQSLVRQWSVADEEAVWAALCDAQVEGLAERTLDALSGGQRQRVWIAMALAQQTPILLLDEPTTYLDIAHQVEVLDLAWALYRQGRTVVAVLHDLNLAFRYATNLVVMSEGRILVEGEPAQVVTSELIEQAFGLANTIITDPISATPLVIPLMSR
ncbi:MAG: ABC transporter ATP-binding protein [Coriobacteriales bacterium]|jgi:iron complex transport system ATP-binding protein|nr:ABC transporter ATP-binding protein [Coriobacteriales bacterium]